MSRKFEEFDLEGYSYLLFLRLSVFLEVSFINFWLSEINFFNDRSARATGQNSLSSIVKREIIEVKFILLHKISKKQSEGASTALVLLSL